MSVAPPASITVAPPGGGGAAAPVVTSVMRPSSTRTDPAKGSAPEPSMMRALVIRWLAMVAGSLPEGSVSV